MNYLLADLCCCAGLAADGYAEVFGAEAIHGFDISDQPDYPYAFWRLDVMPMLEDPDSALNAYDALHTSFPCQIHTTAGHLRKAQGGKSRFEDLLTPGLALLREHWNDKPWVVENVDDRSKKVRAIMAPREGESLIVLCGTMFGLPIWRHRLFLANFPLTRPAPTGKGVYGQLGCRHDICPPDPLTGRPRPWGIYHVAGDQVPSGGRTCHDEAHAQQVMGSTRLLPWDSTKEGIPPAYATHIGLDMFAELRRRDEAAA